MQANLVRKVFMIRLSELQIGRYEYDYELDSPYFTSMEHPFLLGGQVHAHAILDLREDDYDLRISVKGEVQVTCDRCLDPMTLEVEAEDEMEVEEDAQTIDLDWLAYELIIVNLPTVHCHPEGECNPVMDQLLQAHLCRTDEEPEAVNS